MACARATPQRKRRSSRLSKQSQATQLSESQAVTNRAAGAIGSYTLLHRKRTTSSKFHCSHPTLRAHSSPEKGGLNHESEIDTSLLLRRIFEQNLRFSREQQVPRAFETQRGAEIIQVIFRVFCIAFGEHTGYTETGAGPAAGSAEHNSSSFPFGTSLAAPGYSGGGSSKRERSDDPGKGNEKRRKTRPATSRAPKVFACPYFKYNSVRFWKCHQTFRNVADIRQHLARAGHQPPLLHCPICFLEFEDDLGDPPDDAYNTHVREESCHPSPTPPRWLTETQQNQIAASAGAGGTAEENWYTIWNIIFPNASLRPSPYSYCDPIVEIVRTALLYYFRTGEANESINELQTATEQDQMRIIQERILHPQQDTHASLTSQNSSAPAQPTLTAQPRDLPSLFEDGTEYTLHPQSPSAVLEGIAYHDSIIRDFLASLDGHNIHNIQFLEQPEE